MAKYESQKEVIRAITKASDAELRVLADIRRLLNGSGGPAPLRVVRPNAAGNFRQPKQNNLGKHLEGIINDSISATTGRKKGTRSATHGIPTGFNGGSGASVSLSTVRKSRRDIQKAVNGTVKELTEAITKSIRSKSTTLNASNSATTRRIPQQRNTPSNAVHREAPPASGHYYDKGGRLRDSSGKYVAGSGKIGSNNQPKKAGEGDEQKETNALLRRMVGSMARGAANALPGEEGGNTVAAAAGMGVMWQSSKELMNLAKEAGQNTVAMSKWMNQAQKNVRNGSKKILRGFSANDARASVAESKALAGEEARKEQHRDQERTHTNQEKEIALLELLVGKKGGGSDGGSGGLLESAAGAVAGGIFGKGMRFLGRAGKGVGKAGKGLFRRITGKGGAAVTAEVGEDVAKVGGKTAVKVGEAGVEKLAEGSLVKAGEKGLLKTGLKTAAKLGIKGVAKMGLRAIPGIGTLAGVGMDAWDGWHDDKQLKTTFGDKAGTKERVAQTAASVLDMGGLVSGTSNLVSGVLGGLGFDKASKAFQMDGSGELAKSIDTLIGGSEKKDDKRNESVIDKLGDVVDAISTLSGGLTLAAPRVPMPGQVGQTAQNLVRDMAVVTGKVDNQTVTSVSGAANKMRQSKGLSVNPQAMITIGGASAQVRGVAMNNPGNLSFAGQAGAMPEVGGKDTKHRFAAFATPEEGIRAAGNQLLRYKGQGNTTISSILNKWAPKSDKNDTDQYIKSVTASMGSGYTGDSVIDASDPEVTAKLIKAFALHENGSFAMSTADVQKSLGSVQGGRYVGDWTDATKAELSKTARGKEILANNTGAKGSAVTSGNGLISSVTGFINNKSAAIPGVVYDASKAGMGLDAVHSTKISGALNGDALVNASIKNILPSVSRAMPVQNGLLSNTFNSLTQGITGGNIVNNLTRNMNPQLAAAISPLTGAVGRGMNSVINVGKTTVGGWLNGAPASQRSVTDLAASGASTPVSPDNATVKAQSQQQSTLEEIAGYLEQILGIQKKAPTGGADTPRAGAQPGPTGEIPLASRSAVMSQILKR